MNGYDILRKTLSDIMPIRVRMKNWNPRAYLEIRAGEMQALLFDPYAQEANGWPVPQTMIIWQCGLASEGWELYTGEPYKPGQPNDDPRRF